MSDEMRGIRRRSNARTNQSLLRRLARDTAGNVLAITAAATIPMLGVIGGAVDISRIYVTKSRLQAACDSAVLAGRKAMTTTTYTATAKQRAEKMFNVNFQQDDYGASGTTFASSADATGKVSGTAATNMPMVLMDIFGIETSQVTVTCSADIQVPNIDIVFVLDVTGSMNDCADGWCSVGEQRKIDALKVAVKEFYTTLQQAMAGNTVSQVRYGFVPYSQAVNGLDLFKSSPDTTKGELSLTNLVDTMQVESRVANFATAVANWIPDPNSTPVSYEQTFYRNSTTSKEPFQTYSANNTPMANTDCNYYSSNLSFNISGIDLDVNLYPRIGENYTKEGRGSSEFYQKDGESTWTTTQPSNGNGYTKITFERVTPRFDDDGRTSRYSACTRRVTRTHYVKDIDYKFTGWTYKPVSYNVAQFKTGSRIEFASAISSTFTVDNPGTYTPVELAQLPNRNGLTISLTDAWDGCLEERTTTAATNFAPIPDAAKDLNYIDGGTSDLLRWRPILQDLTYNRGRVEWRENTTTNYGHPDYTCPTARMRNLNVMTQNEFNTYVNGLQAGGYTYLDVGMIWGLRLIMPQGMFASRNLTGPNGGQIARHIIFLTDGFPVSQGNTYSAYGVEDMSARITGTTGESAATLHARRFQALCDAQRGSINIWAIAFGTSVTGNMQSCADPGRALEADDPTELNAAFRTIAQQVADLRLVQ